MKQRAIFQCKEYLFVVFDSAFDEGISIAIYSSDFTKVGQGIVSKDKVISTECYNNNLLFVFQRSDYSEYFLTVSFDYVISPVTEIDTHIESVVYTSDIIGLYFNGGYVVDWLNQNKIKRNNPHDDTNISDQTSTSDMPLSSKVAISIFIPLIVLFIGLCVVRMFFMKKLKHQTNDKSSEKDYFKQSKTNNVGIV